MPQNQHLQKCIKTNNFNSFAIITYEKQGAGAVIFNHHSHQSSLIETPPNSMSLTLRTYEQHDFGALHRLDQSCFPPGIAYSRMTLHYFLSRSSANCVVALEGKKIVGFILTEENPPLGHTVTLRVAPGHRRHGIASA